MTPKKLLEKYGVKEISGGAYKEGFMDGLRCAEIYHNKEAKDNE